MAQGPGTWGSPSFEAEQGSTSPDEIRKAQARYKRFDRYSTNRDGKHVDSEHWAYGDRRRLRNLSDKQKEIVGPKLDREKVSLT
jgi:hypothetical protein